MKKLLSLFAVTVIAVLFAGCPLKPKNVENVTKGTNEKETQKQTVLNIKNQSSIAVKNIKYDGKEAVFSKTGGKENVLEAGDACSVNLSGEAKGYIYFTVVDTENKTVTNVRTNETVIVEKEKTTVFTITDNILVVPIGKTKPIRIFDLMNIAVLKVYNKTSFDIVEISYAGMTNKSILGVGSEWEKWFTESMKDELVIKILRKKDNTVISVTLKDEITVKVGSIKEITITNTSLVIEEGETEVRELRRVLGMGILTVINKSTAKSISKIKFAGAIHEAVLPQGPRCDFECKNAIEDYIYFVLETQLGKYDVKTSDKINLTDGEEKTITLTNDTLISVEYTQPSKISSLIYAAELEIINASSTELLNVIYDNPDKHNFGTIQMNMSNGVIYWDYAAGAYPISFEIKTPSGNIVKVKTTEIIALKSSEKISFVITDNSQVIFAGSGKSSLIRNILGINELKIINQTSAVKISNLNFSGVLLEDLSKGGVWSIKFNSPVENNLFFTIQTGITTFNVSTEEKIKIIDSDNTFTLTDDVLVIPGGHTDAYKISVLLNAACFEIVNQSDFTMYNVTYDNFNLGTIQDHNSSGSWTHWNFTIKKSPISFVIYSKSQAIQLTTHESVELRPGWNKSYRIDDDTLVKYNGTVVPLGSF